MGMRVNGRLALLFVSLTIAVGISLLAACNSMEGFGRDVQRGGEAIEDKAKDVKDGR